MTLSYDPSDCPRNLRGVKVELLQDDNTWMEIPTTYVETSIGRGGSATYNRLSEVRFPLEWEGEDVAGEIKTFGDLAGVYDIARVSFASYQTNKIEPNNPWRPVHTGYVAGVGSSGDAGVGHFVIKDFSDFLETIPASVNFKEGASWGTVMDYIHGQLAENTMHPYEYIIDAATEDELLGGKKIPIPKDRETPKQIEILTDETANRENLIQATGDEEDKGKFWEQVDDLGQSFLEDVQQTRSTGEVKEVGGETLGLWETIYNAISTDGPFSSFLRDPHTFTANEDTLADVMNWFTSHVGLDWHFVSTGELALQLPWQNNWTDHTIDSPTTHTLHTIESDAFKEINPNNAVKVAGDTALVEFGENAAVSMGKKFPTATAAYEPHVERAGGKLFGRVIESNTGSMNGVKNEAKKRLKKTIRDGHGDIKVYGRSELFPTDTVLVRPSCNGIVSHDVNPIKYGVERVHHRKSSDGVYKSLVEVTGHYDPDKVIMESETVESIEQEFDDDGE